jgi:hypothetical protein
MVTTERPCCDQPLTVEMPLPESLRCDDCAVTWSVTDPEAEALALAA